MRVEEHLARLRESLIPLAQRCGQVMREALSALETLRSTPSNTVERSKPIRVSFCFGQNEVSSASVAKK